MKDRGSLWTLAMAMGLLVPAFALGDVRCKVGMHNTCVAFGVDADTCYATWQVSDCEGAPGVAGWTNAVPGDPKDGYRVFKGDTINIYGSDKVKKTATPIAVVKSGPPPTIVSVECIGWKEDPTSVVSEPLCGTRPFCYGVGRCQDNMSNGSIHAPHYIDLVCLAKADGQCPGAGQCLQQMDFSEDGKGDGARTVQSAVAQKSAPDTIPAVSPMVGNMKCSPRSIRPGGDSEFGVALLPKACNRSKICVGLLKCSGKGAQGEALEFPGSAVCGTESQNALSCASAAACANDKTVVPYEDWIKTHPQPQPAPSGSPAPAGGGG